MSDGLAPDRLIGERFRLLAPLDRGGAGRVWRAVDERTGGPVAIRFQRGRPGPDPAARVVHPHVVSAFFFGTHEDAGYSVMELVDGVSLATILDEGIVPEDDAWRIAAQVCQALHAAHRVGVTHGNLKPSNVLIADEGFIKVVGFTGDGGSRQDMYSLGLLLEAMSGRRDPIVKRLLSREPYTSAQLHEILTGSTLDDAGSRGDDGDDGDDGTERRRLARLAVVSSVVTLAVVAACAWFLAPTAPPDFRSDGGSGGLPSSLSDQPDQPSAELIATSKPPVPAPGASTGRDTAVGGNPDNVAISAAINAVKAVIAKELSTGQIEPDAAASLTSKLDDVARFQSRGQGKQATDRIDMLKSQLSLLRKDNKVTAKGYNEILASLNTL